MIDQVVAAFGSKWLLALVIVFLGALAEGGGKPKRVAEGEAVGDAKQSALLGALSGIATTISVVLLLAHVLLTPVTAEAPNARVIALVAIASVAAVAGFVGQGFASMSEPFRILCAVARLPLSAVGLAASVYATIKTAPLFLHFVATLTGGAR